MVYPRIITSLESKQLSISLVKTPIGDNNHIGVYKYNKNLIVAISTSRNEIEKKNKWKKKLLFSNDPCVYTHIYI